MTDRIRVTPDGQVRGYGRTFRCALGRGGIVGKKREGDGGTPAGIWHPVAVGYRADRTFVPATSLPVLPIRRGDGWCDAAGDSRYNQPVHHPFRASAEHMWRNDQLYNLVVVLDHNRAPVVPGGGSAIFIHVARPNHGPTEGCIALAIPDLRLLVSRMTGRTLIMVEGDQPAGRSPNMAAPTRTWVAPK